MRTNGQLISNPLNRCCKGGGGGKGGGTGGSKRPLTSDYSKQMFAAAQKAGLPANELKPLRNMLSTVDRTGNANQKVASTLRDMEVRLGVEIAPTPQAAKPAAKPKATKPRNNAGAGSKRPLTSDYSKEMFAAAQKEGLPAQELRALRNTLSTVDRTGDASQGVASRLREYEGRFGM